MVFPASEEPDATSPSPTAVSHGTEIKGGLPDEAVVGNPFPVIDPHGPEMWEFSEEDIKNNRLSCDVDGCILVPKKIDVEDLLRNYRNYPMTADRAYKNRRFAITGVIGEIFFIRDHFGDDGGRAYIRFTGDKEKGSVLCENVHTVLGWSLMDVYDLRIGSTQVVIGKITGQDGEGEIYVDNCRFKAEYDRLENFSILREWE